MKNRAKKYVLSLGTAAVLAAPIITVVACGSDGRWIFISQEDVDAAQAALAKVGPTTAMMDRLHDGEEQIMDQDLATALGFGELDSRFIYKIINIEQDATNVNEFTYDVVVMSDDMSLTATSPLHITNDKLLDPVVLLDQEQARINGIVSQITAVEEGVFKTVTNVDATTQNLSDFGFDAITFNTELYTYLLTTTEIPGAVDPVTNPKGYGYATIKIVVTAKDSTVDARRTEQPIEKSNIFVAPLPYKIEAARASGVKTLTDAEQLRVNNLTLTTVETNFTAIAADTDLSTLTPAQIEGLGLTSFVPDNTNFKYLITQDGYSVVYSPAGAVATGETVTIKVVAKDSNSYQYAASPDGYISTINTPTPIDITLTDDAALTLDVEAAVQDLSIGTVTAIDTEVVDGVMDQALATKLGFGTLDTRFVYTISNAVVTQGSEDDVNDVATFDVTVTNANPSLTSTTVTFTDVELASFGPTSPDKAAVKAAIDAIKLADLSVWAQHTVQPVTAFTAVDDAFKRDYGITNELDDQSITYKYKAAGYGYMQDTPTTFELELTKGNVSMETGPISVTVIPRWKLVTEVFEGPSNTWFTTEEAAADAWWATKTPTPNVNPNNPTDTEWYTGFITVVPVSGQPGHYNAEFVWNSVRNAYTPTTPNGDYEKEVTGPRMDAFAADANSPTGAYIDNLDSFYWKGSHTITSPLIQQDPNDFHHFTGLTLVKGSAADGRPAGVAGVGGNFVPLRGGFDLATMSDTTPNAPFNNWSTGFEITNFPTGYTSGVDISTLTGTRTINHLATRSDLDAYVAEIPRKTGTFYVDGNANDGANIDGLPTSLPAE